MPIRVQPYGPEHVAAVRAFNVRLREGGAPEEFDFPETHVPEWAEEGNISQRKFLALEGEIVRGGFLLRNQRFHVQGEICVVGHYRLPLSEGIVNRSYAMVGPLLLRSALQTQPMLFALGMGGADKPLPRMLKAAGWSLAEVPFQFRVERASRFLREMPMLRKDFKRRLLARLAAVTGAGWAANRIWQLAARRRFGGVQVTSFTEFGGWADDLWESCRGCYALLAVRDRKALQLLYPASDPRLLRYRVEGEGRLYGWVIALDTPMREHRHFGNLRVGTIVDGLCHPKDASIVVAAAAEALSRRGVDLIISNQSHTAWNRALREAGFCRGPSNFLFAVSKQLAARLAGSFFAAGHGPAPESAAASRAVRFEEQIRQCHINRGDGDGPIHL